MAERATIEDICTVSWLKEVYLLGVDLTLDDGSPYPDIIYINSIESAINFIEGRLSINIEPRTISAERHDRTPPIVDSWTLLETLHIPVRAVESVSIQIGHQPQSTFPASWVMIRNKILGQLQLVPTPDGSAFYFTFQGILPYFTQSKFPAYFAITYETGYAMVKDTIEDVEDTTYTLTFGETFGTDLKTYFVFRFYDADDRLIAPTKAISRAPRAVVVSKSATGATIRVENLSLQDPDAGPFRLEWVAHQVPADVLDAVGNFASRNALNIAGDLIAGAGIASKSVSQDGLSQSINTTSSATNSGYGARIIQFEKYLDALMPALVAKYRRFMLATI